MLAKIYRKFLKKAERFPGRISKMKTTIAEYYEIIRKKRLYSNIRWTKTQKKEYKQYWKKLYKNIPNWWNRLYQAASGKYNLQYVPEKVFTTYLEPTLNDYAYSKVLANKSLLEFICSKSNVLIPETILVCDGGLLFNADRKMIDFNSAIKSIQCEKSDLVIKRTSGSSSGKDVLFIDEANRTKDSVTKLLSSFGYNYLVQKAIKQNAVYEGFNSSSVNTIRIITFRTSSGIYHAPICFRIGRKNKKVDNIHAGGIVVGVEESGNLYEYGFELGYGDKIEKYALHPDSNVSFAGVKLPLVPEIIKEAIKLHGRFTHVNIISWDFAVDEKKQIVLIEANTQAQGVWFPQMITGEGLFGDKVEEVFNLAASYRGRNKND